MSYLPDGNNLHRGRNIYFPDRSGESACLDGPVWVSGGNMASSFFWRAVAMQAGGLIAAAGGRNPAGGAFVSAFTSDGGVTWANSATPPAGPAGGQGIPEMGMVWLPLANVFFSCGGTFLNNSATSPDGNVWATTNIAGFLSTTGIFMIGDTACVVRGNHNQASLTTDGVTANVRALPVFSYTNGVSDGASIAYVASASALNPGARSTDGGLTWANGANLPFNASAIARGAFGNGVMVYPGAGALTRVAVSNDLGLTWAQSNVLPGSGGGTIVTDLVFTQGVFLLIAGQATPAGQLVYTSVDGVTWNLVANLMPATGGVGWAIAHNGAGNYVGVLGNNGGQNRTAVGVC